MKRLAAALVGGVLAAAMAGGSALAQARDYYRVGEDEDSVVFVDVASVKTVGDHRTYWATVVYKELKTTSGIQYAFMAGLVEADCPAGKVRRMAMDVRSDAYVTVYQDTDAGEWRPAEPGTFFGGELAYACGTAKPGAGSVVRGTLLDLRAAELKGH